MGLIQTSRRINHGRPAAAPARFAKWQVQSRLRDEVIFDWIDGAKLAVRRGMTGAASNIYFGLHEFGDVAFVLHLLREDDLFLDLDANIGSMHYAGLQGLCFKVHIGGA